MRLVLRRRRRATLRLIRAVEKTIMVRVHRVECCAPFLRSFPLPAIDDFPFSLRVASQHLLRDFAYSPAAGVTSALCLITLDCVAILRYSFRSGLRLPLPFLDARGQCFFDAALCDRRFPFARRSSSP